MKPTESLPATLGRGAAAGLLGTGVMTAFQLLVEMPLTKRDESYAPADLVMKMLPVRSGSASARRQLNYVAHFGLGVGWGVARGVAARRGLRGQAAVAGVFAAMYPTDVATATVFGVYRPLEWSAQDWAIDVVDKLVQAEATGLAYDLLARRA